MHVRPEVEALRRDDMPQRRAQAAMRAAMADWRGAAAPVLAEVERFAENRPLAECPALAALFGGKGADDFVDTFVRAHTAALAEEPLGHVAARHFADRMFATLLVARRGGVTLTLTATDGEALRGSEAARSAVFAACDTWEAVLAGSGEGESIALRGGVLSREPVALRAGMVLHREAGRQALLVHSVDGRLVTLRLQRRRAGAGPAREFDLAGGRQVHQAAGDPGDSRAELVMALLGRMGRTDAAPLMAQIARGDGSSALRWQALRECLALDTGAGFAALTALATADDDLARPAGALRAQLIEAHPQLAELACPA